MCGRRNDPDAALGVIAAALGAAHIATHNIDRGYSATATSTGTTPVASAFCKGS
jgi:S-adenosylmethionine/arginine decarboxylase-like enzyme